MVSSPAPAGTPHLAACTASGKSLRCGAQAASGIPACGESRLSSQTQRRQRQNLCENQKRRPHRTPQVPRPPHTHYGSQTKEPDTSQRWCSLGTWDSRRCPEVVRDQAWQGRNVAHAARARRAEGYGAQYRESAKGQYLYCSDDRSMRAECGASEGTFKEQAQGFALQRSASVCRSLSKFRSMCERSRGATSC